MAHEVTPAPMSREAVQRILERKPRCIVGSYHVHTPDCHVVTMSASERDQLCALALARQTPTPIETVEHLADAFDARYSPYGGDIVSLTEVRAWLVSRPIHDPFFKVIP
jgi:hypothetical protein